MHNFPGEWVQLLIPTAAGLSLLIFSHLLPQSIATADFTSEVRPILSRQCLPCHGPDAATRTKDLRLDMKDQLLGVIEVGSAESSPLFQRISSDDPELRMPPPDHAKALSSEEISILKQWIDAGAAWEEHWAFTPPVMPAAEWNTHQHPIDVFIDDPDPVTVADMVLGHRLFPMHNTCDHCVSCQTDEITQFFSSNLYELVVGFLEELGLHCTADEDSY